MSKITKILFSAVFFLIVSLSFAVGTVHGQPSPPASPPSESGGWSFSKILPFNNADEAASAKLDPTNPANDPIFKLLNNVFKLLMLLGGGVAVIFIFLGAFYYFTAFGNEERAATGKKIITYAIIGVVVVVLGEVLINTVWQFFTSEKLTLPTK